MNAGLSARIATGSGVQTTANEFFLIWDTIIGMTSRTDLPTFIGRGMANGAVSPVFFAMSCAKDLRPVFARFARFKTLFGPVGMIVREINTRLHVALVPVHPQPVLPASQATPILIFLHEKARSCTARTLLPAEVHLPIPQAERDALTDVFGLCPRDGTPRLVYSAVDGRRHFVWENAALCDNWRTATCRSSRSLICSPTGTQTHFIVRSKPGQAERRMMRGTRWPSQQRLGRELGKPRYGATGFPVGTRLTPHTGQVSTPKFGDHEHRGRRL